MKKFLVLYHASVSAAQQMAGATPEQMKGGMDAWADWTKRTGRALVDPGMPLENAAAISAASGASLCTITGYSLLQAESVDTLRDLPKAHSHRHVPGSSIEVLGGCLCLEWHDETQGPEFALGIVLRA